MADYDKAYAIWKGYRGATAPEYMEMNRLIGKALLRQIPREPKDKGRTKTGSKTTYGFCPECGALVTKLCDHHFCNSCGQAMDWGDADA